MISVLFTVITVFLCLSSDMPGVKLKKSLVIFWCFVDSSNNGTITFFIYLLL